MRVTSNTNNTTNSKYTIREYINGKGFYKGSYLHHYVITEPQGIISDLMQCEKDCDLKNKMDGYIDFINKTKIFQNEQIYGITGLGSQTSAFDIGNERVLKISRENPFEYRQYNPKFDIPLLSEIVHYDNLYGYIQQKAETDNITTLDVAKVKRRMKKAGFKPSRDFNYYRIEQVGIFNGKSYLLDSRCAITENDFKTRFANWFQKYFDRSPIILTPIENIMNLPPVHINEKPQINYSIKEVKKIINKVFKSWKDSPYLNEKIIYKCLKTIQFI